jgi:hypothetical protein
MTQLAITEGFEHVPPQEAVDSLRSSQIKEVVCAIDDIYTYFVLAGDYEAGDEGQFWPEIFEAAIAAYAHESERPIAPDEKDAAELAIRASCDLLARHGFEEPLFDDNEADTKE